MIVYEFWLREQFRTQAFEILCESFYSLGKMMNRWDDPKDEETGLPIESSCVYSISRNLNTHWVQLLIDENTPAPFITAIEARINGLKDDEPMRKYIDAAHNDSPIETPKHFSLEGVLRVRQKQKDGTLGEIEDA